MTTNIIVGFKTLTSTGKIPVYSSAEAAGADLHADLGGDGESVVLLAGERLLVRCGIAIELPEGFEAQVRPRSGLAFKNGITILNAPGTIDSDYRGELAALLINTSHDDFTIKHGDRIAQLVVAPVVRANFVATGGFVRATERGSGGFGSTGV